MVKTAPPADHAKPGSGEECFVIMPISDPEGYPPGHFERVYKDLFSPAIERAGFVPRRADDVLETNVIHLDLLRRLLDAPMALCDLSSRNPNVLFELGLRQAFDKPVILVAEEGTPRIFDVDLLRFTSYRPARIYHQVIEDQQRIAEAIEATRSAAAEKRGINSLVHLLGITKPASVAEISDAQSDPALQLVLSELGDIRREMRRLASDRPPDSVTMRALRRADAEDVTPVQVVRAISFAVRASDPELEVFRSMLAKWLPAPAKIRFLPRATEGPVHGSIEFGSWVPLKDVESSVVLAAKAAAIPVPSLFPVEA